MNHERTAIQEHGRLWAEAEEKVNILTERLDSLYSYKGAFNWSDAAELNRLNEQLQVILDTFPLKTSDLSNPGGYL